VDGTFVRGRLPPRLDAAQRRVIGGLKDWVYRATEWPAFQSVVLTTAPKLLPLLERSDERTRRRLLRWAAADLWAPACIRMLGQIQDGASVVRIGQLAASTDGISPSVLAALLTAYCAVGVWDEAASLAEDSSGLCGTPAARRCGRRRFATCA